MAQNSIIETVCSPLNKEKFVTPVSKQFHHWLVALLSLFEVLQTF